jgi:O-antigen/teichoic acid export membrane protein
VKGAPSLTPADPPPGSLLRNILSNWFVLGTGIAYALFITPIIVRALDKELYGVWSFLNGLLAYSELLYLGLGSAVIKYVAQFLATNDRQGINRLASVVVLIYSVLGLACFAVLAGVSGWVPQTFAQPLSVEAARAASYTCLLLGAQMLFIFVGSAFSGLMGGFNRYDLVNIVQVGGVLIRFAATPVLVRAGHDPLLMLATITSTSAILQAGALVGLAFWYIPTLSIRPTRPSVGELRLLYGFGLQSFFVSFAGRLISYTDTTVIGVTLGAASVALYVLPLQLVEYARMFLGGFSGVFLPRLTMLTTRGDMAGVRHAYIRAMRMASFLAGWLVALLVYLGPMFLNRWVGHDFGTPVQWVLVCLAAATFAQVLSTQAPYAFYQALHLVSFPAMVLTIEALLNLALSVWLAPRLGITGVALATAVPALLVSFLLLPPYLCRRLGVPFRTFVVQGALPGVLMVVASLSALWLAGRMVTSESYAGMIGRLVATLPVALVLFRVTFPIDQREALWRVFRFNAV